MAQLESQHDKIAAKGLKVVAIGLGQPKHAQRYCGKLAPSLTCLSNERSKLNRTYGLTEGSLLAITTSPSAVRNGMRAYRAGFRQGKSTGNVKMLPGTFVVDSEGIIRFAHYGKNAGDHVDIDTLLHSIE